MRTRGTFWGGLVVGCQERVCVAKGLAFSIGYARGRANYFPTIYDSGNLVSLVYRIWYNLQQRA